MLELRYYQREACDAVYSYWQEGGGNPLLDLATGVGKSVVLATICQELLEQWPGLRIGAITHVKELIVQNAKELLGLWPSAPIGIYSAGVGRRDRNARILFMGIQSVWNKDLGDFDVLIVDEAHSVPKDAETMYGKFIAKCRERVPDMRIVGLTATPYRLGTGRLDRGEGRIFDKIVYTYGLADGVRDGFLCPLVTPPPGVELDTKGLHIRQGDFVRGELEAAALDGDYLKKTAQDLRRLFEGRCCMLVFCAGVAHCWEMKAALSEAGLEFPVLTDETASGERDRIINGLKNRSIRGAINISILSTGTNIPHVDLIGMCTSTLSTGRLVQIGGRGTRLSPATSKTNCIFADYGGNIRRHGPLDAISVITPDDKPKEKVEPKDVAAKWCPSCENAVPVQTRTCPHCDFVWERAPDDEPKHEDRADTASHVMVSTLPPEWSEVMNMEVSRHAKADKTPSMKVAYWCGLKTHSEWICFEHSGFPRQKAIQWWRSMGGQLPIPETVVEAIGREKELRQPSHVLVKPGKFAEIVNRKFEVREVVEEELIPF